MTWHILTTEPRRETAVAASLVGHRVPVYLPTHQVQVRAAPNTAKPFRIVDRPLFPGYLFARMADGAAWKAVHASPGWSGYLRGPEGPKTLSEAAIDAIKKIESGLAHGLALNEFGCGDHVRVATDDDWCPWNGYEGIVQRLDRADRITISLISPGHAIRVSVPSQWLKGVG